MNVYDRAARLVPRTDPIGSMQWLAPGLDPLLGFTRRLDTRNSPEIAGLDRTQQVVTVPDLGIDRREVAALIRDGFTDCA